MKKNHKHEPHKHSAVCSSRHKHLEEVEGLLVEADLKKTPFRVHLLELLKSVEKPLSALEIFTALDKQKAKHSFLFDRATVFRNVKMLAEKGVLLTSEFGTGAAHFSLKTAKHMHHIFCVKCEAIEAIDFCAVAPMIEQAKRKGYEVLSHRLELIGVCSSCR